MSFPLCDLAYFQRETVLPVEYIEEVEGKTPGFVHGRIRAWSSRIYANLRKRYGNTLPFGQAPPPLTASGTLPPGVSLSGVPVLGSLFVQIQITTPGAVGTAIFSWSSDDGLTWTTGATTSTTPVVLPNTGLSVLFPPLSIYTTDNLYVASAPVPECLLNWIVQLTAWDVMRKHGANTTDPQTTLLANDFTTALADLEKAANSKDGLFDLPAVDDGASAISSGGPLWYTESSPYVSADVAEANGRQNDWCHQGSISDENGGVVVNPWNQGQGGFCP
jgi:hypothetical protein